MEYDSGVGVQAAWFCGRVRTRAAEAVRATGCWTEVVFQAERKRLAAQAARISGGRPRRRFRRQGEEGRASWQRRGRILVIDPNGIPLLRVSRPSVGFVNPD